MGKLWKLRQKLNQYEKGKNAYDLYCEWMEYDGETPIEFAMLPFRQQKAWIMAICGIRKNKCKEEFVGVWHGIPIDGENI